MKPRHGAQRVAIFLAMAVGVFCACCCVLLVAERHYWARNRLDRYRQELEGWEACRVGEPSFYRANVDVVSLCLENLTESQQDFWVKVSNVQLMGLYILAGLGGAVGGSLATWVVLSFTRKVVCGPVGRLMRGSPADVAATSPRYPP
ncbi:MAG: hypothetical protein JSU70_02635 [Phycisphaerales bacterium]|nr:MAG: hypothetical protein JSU70_02635 [Phycisphaerales bacterium]